MPIELISSVITALGVAVPSIIATIVSNNSTRKLLSYRIEELEKKQDKHNQVITRTYELEKKSALHEEEIRKLEEEVHEK